MVFRSPSFINLLNRVWLIFGMVCLALPVVFAGSTPRSYAQDDPTARINELAERVYIQNMRTQSITRWVGGDLGELAGSEIAAPAGTRFESWYFTDLYEPETEVRLDSLTRPVLMNIWASWCGPCRFEFPFLTTYALSENRSYDLWFVDANDTPAAAKRFLTSQAEGIQVYVDPDDAFIGSIGLRVFPTTILMNGDGSILAAHSGIVTRTIMEFFEAVAANPNVGSFDPATLTDINLSAILGEVDPASATPLVYGQQVVGELNSETWRQDYRFEGRANEEISISMVTADADLDAYLVLIGPDGERVAENDDSGSGTDSRINLTLPSDGTYIIVATRFLEQDGFGSGGFNLQVTTSAQQPSTSGNANLLQVGIPSSGRLTYELKQQNYVLDLVEGQVVTFTLTHDLPDDQLSLQARLGSERLFPYSKTENGELVIEATVPATGSYSVYVARSQSSRSGPITFTLVVEGDNEATTSSETPQNESRVLAYASSVTDSLSDSSYQHEYTFAGQAGDVIRVDLALVAGTGNLDTVLRLVGPDGSILAENDDADLATTNSRITDFTLPESGSYTIVATRYDGENGFSAGEYTLSLNATVSSAPAPQVDGSGLGYGQAVEGTIDNSTFEVSYTFEGQAQDRVSIQAHTISGNLDTTLALIAADGSILAENDDFDFTTTDAAILDFSLPSDGVYSIKVSRFGGESGSSLGNFSLTLEAVTGAGAVDLPSLGGDALPIEFDHAVQGRIDDESPSVMYQFAGIADEVVAIEMQAIDGNLDTVVSLLDAQGEVVATNDDMSVASTNSLIVAARLPEDGNYTIVASRFDGEAGLSSGDYELVLRHADESQIPVVAQNTLAYGEQASGYINNSIYEFEYEFEGVADDVISIELYALSGDLDPYLILVGPDDRILYTNDDIDLAGSNYNAAIIGYALPSSGTYTIIATRFDGSSGNGEGDFELRLSEGTIEVPVPPVISPNSITGSIRYGETVTGFIDNRSPEYVYTFEANAGDTITIELNASSGDLDPYVALVSSDDVMLTSNDDVDLFAGNFNAAIIGYTIAETGSYSIIATRYDGENGASSGEFALSLYTSIASIPIDNPPAASSHLSYGEHIEGSIDDEHYAYTYTFNGNAGDIISITVDASSGDLDTFVALLNDAGEILASNDDVNLFEGNVNSAILDYPLPETATYSILVSRYDGELGFTAGEFTLNLSTSNGGSSTPPPTETSELVYNSSAEGSLDNNQYEARYTFVGASGDHISIDLISISGNLDPYLVLIAPDGEIVAENDDSDITTRNAAILDFTLSQTGIYTIVATRFEAEAGLSSGTYRLSLSGPAGEVVIDPPPVSDAASIAFGETISGTIDSNNLEDRLVFNAEAGQIIDVTMYATGGNLDAYISIIDASGKEIVFNDNALSSTKQDAAIVGFKIPADGTYTIIATRYGVYYGRTSGTYELSLSLR